MSSKERIYEERKKEDEIRMKIMESIIREVRSWMQGK